MELLKKLTQINSPSGNEETISKFIEDEIKDYVDEVYYDNLGNLIAHKKGQGARVMFDAHTDEIGVIALFIEDNGYIRFSNLGGVSAYNALYRRVRFLNGTEGVIALDASRDDIMKNLKLSDLYIDIGAKDKEEAQKKISIGDVASFVGEFSDFGDKVVSKALDDRVGCYCLIRAIKEIKSHKNDLYFVFAASEELGLRGAKAAAHSINPEYAVAIDVTSTGDTLGKRKMAVRTGAGAAIKIKDNSILCHPYIKSLMLDTCEKDDIPYQLEVLEFGGTDAGAIHLSCGGVATGAISIPTRYIHSPAEMVDKNDIEAAVTLCKKLIEQGF
ncbi:MAG: M42 family metallopeptidase [Clostridia bacterium]|nr:M42 family metallopeptidase [Clostridia bacterium]